MNDLLLDTHYWIWLQTGDARELGREARVQLLAWQRRQALYISAMSVWEVARLVADAHLDLGTSMDQFLAQATGESGLRLLALETNILIESTRLPGDIHRDPADRVLAATARHHGLTLVTRDKALLDYGKRGHIKVLKL